MTKTKLSHGGLVRLRSGGPTMTAERVWLEIPMPYARCVWFDERRLYHTANFSLEALEPLDPPET